MSDKWVAILGAGREQIPAIQAAHRAGYAVVAFDKDIEAPGAVVADQFVSISNRDTGRIVETLSKWMPESGRDLVRMDLRGVVAAGSEVAVEAAAIADELGLPNIGSAAQKCRDKLLLKEILHEHGVPHTPAEFYSQFNMATTPSKAVIKPRYGSGSRGVTLWTGGASEWQEAVFLARSVAAPEGRHQGVLIEPYEPGPQVSTEAIIWDGRCEMVAMVDRHYDDSKLPKFVELGGRSPYIHEDAWRASCHHLMAKAAEAIGLNRGTLKGDIVISPSGPKIIECHPRLSGGPLWKLALESTGIDYFPEAVRIACGEVPRWEKLQPTKSVVVEMNMLGEIL